MSYSIDAVREAWNRQCAIIDSAMPDSFVKEVWSDFLVVQSESGLYRVPFEVVDDVLVGFGTPEPTRVAYLSNPSERALWTLEEPSALVLLAGRVHVGAHWRTTSDGKRVHVNSYFRSPSSLSMDDLFETISYLDTEGRKQTGVEFTRYRTQLIAARNELAKRFKEGTPEEKSQITEWSRNNSAKSKAEEFPETPAPEKSLWDGDIDEAPDSQILAAIEEFVGREDLSDEETQRLDALRIEASRREIGTDKDPEGTGLSDEAAMDQRPEGWGTPTDEDLDEIAAAEVDPAEADPYLDLPEDLRESYREKFPIGSKFQGGTVERFSQDGKIGTRYDDGNMDYIYPNLDDVVAQKNSLQINKDGTSSVVGADGEVLKTYPTIQEGYAAMQADGDDEDSGMGPRGDSGLAALTEQELKDEIVKAEAEVAEGYKTRYNAQNTSNWRNRISEESEIIQAVSRLKSLQAEWAIRENGEPVGEAAAGLTPEQSKILEVASRNLAPGKNRDDTIRNETTLSPTQFFQTLIQMTKDPELSEAADAAYPGVLDGVRSRIGQGRRLSRTPKDQPNDTDSPTANVPEVAPTNSDVPDVSGVQDIVREQGGATLTPDFSSQPTTGYVVAVQGFNKEVPSPEFFDSDAGVESLLDWVLENRAELEQPGRHVGLWWDKDNDEVVFDVSEVFDDKEMAIQAGVDRNQQAIYDIENDEEIDTGGSGDRLTEETVTTDPSGVLGTDEGGTTGVPDGNSGPVEESGDGSGDGVDSSPESDLTGTLPPEDLQAKMDEIFGEGGVPAYATDAAELNIDEANADELTDAAYDLDRISNLTPSSIPEVSMHAAALRRIAAERASRNIDYDDLEDFVKGAISAEQFYDLLPWQRQRVMEAPDADTLKSFFEEFGI